MHALLLATWLTAPVFPLNPVVQDTVAFMNMHFTVGISGPNNLVGSGPELTAKYELRFAHPVVVRTAIGYRFGKVSSIVFPTGELHMGTISVDALYYRGTHKLTGYLGLGVVYTFYRYQLAGHAADSLQRNHSVRDVGLRPNFGFRLTMGLRFHRAISLEVGVTEARPKLQFVERISDTQYSVSKERVRMGDVRVTLGYLWELRGL